jgi:excisionase family DNA binding protein
MSGAPKTLSVSQAAALCGVGRTTVGYWIRSKKLHAHRVGRNYSIPVEDLLFLLQNSRQRIPPEMLRENTNGLILKSFQNCWQHWSSSEHGQNCHGCIAFKNQLQACFTVKDSGLLRCSGCETCRYYIETFLPRIQFVHQIDMPAAVFNNLYLWGGNELCAGICGVQQKDLIGMGIEKIVHAASLPKVIEAVRKMAIGDPALVEYCRIALNKGHQDRQMIRVSVYPLREPAKAFLVLGEPIDSI